MPVWVQILIILISLTSGMALGMFSLSLVLKEKIRTYQELREELKELKKELNQKGRSEMDLIWKLAEAKTIIKNLQEKIKSDQMRKERINETFKRVFGAFIGASILPNKKHLLLVELIKLLPVSKKLLKISKT
jgi:septal ring factor EnvC (AmiA/AmiB activator)